MTTKTDSGPGHGKEMLTSKQRRSLVDSITRNSDVTGTQMAQWTASASAYAREVARSNGKAPAASDGMFWIRTYGVLVEIRNHFSQPLPSASLLRAAGVHPDAARAWYAGIRDAVHAARSQFSDEELVYVEYRRHVECHLFQDSYRLHVAGNGSLIERRKRPLLGRELTVDEAEQAIQGVLRRYRSESAIAVDFAKRAAAHLAAVARLVGAYAEQTMTHS